jgi:hypothetical protein
MANFITYVILFFKYFGWWVLPLIFLFVYKKMLSKYPISVTIYEKRGNALAESNDVAGRFNDPINCYKLKLNKDTIPIPEYDWVIQCMDRPTNLFEKIGYMLSGRIGHITLFKYASKQYKPIKVSATGEIEENLFEQVLDKNGKPVYINVYKPINVSSSLSNVDFEVIDWDDVNHMTQELRAIATRRVKAMDFLQKHAGLISMVLALIALIFAGYYYKEIISDAGEKYINAAQQYSDVVNNQVPVPVADQKIAEAPNIPLLGGLNNNNG